jgi:peptidyl-prolyl cis-trans isomerase D
MRKNVKSLAPMLWFVIAAFIISIFAVWGGGGELGRGRATNTLATVGREKISASLYYQTLRQQLANMQEQFKELDSRFIQQLNVPQQVLEQLIQQTLLLHSAEKLGIRATDTELAEKIRSYPVFQRDGKFIGYEEYKKILEWNRISLSQFEESLKKEIKIDKAVKVIASGVSISPDDLWETYKNNNETAKLEYVVCESEKIELEEEFKLEELKEYYGSHKEEYKIPERRQADYVFFITDEAKEDIVLEDSEITQYYNDNLTQFQDPERTRVSRIYLPLDGKDKEAVLKEAQDVLERLSRGDDFEAMAQVFSKDDKAEEGGDWGLFDWKTLSAAEQDTVADLDAGAVSEPVELEDGYSILKVTEKEPAKQKPLEEVRERIMTILKDQQARDFVEEKASRLERSAKKEKSLDAAAQKLGLQIKSTGLLKEGDSIEDIDPSGSISLSLFQLEEKEISNPIFTYKGVGVAQLQKKDPPRPAEFEEVEEEVKEDIQTEKKKQKALEKIQRVKAEFGNKDLVILADDYGLEYKTVEEHKRNQYIGLVGENSEIDHLAFSLPLEHISDPVAFNNGYTVLRVLDRKEVTKEDFEKNKEAEKETILQTEKNKFIISYLTKLREDLGVDKTIKYDLFFKINSDVLSKYTGEQ